MIRSMTGYGRSQLQSEGRDILVEIKSVNSRYLEQNVRIGRNYTYLEEELKALLKTKVSRGKVEISVTINPLEGRKADIRVNEAIVRGYLDAMRAYNNNYVTRNEQGEIIDNQSGFLAPDGYYHKTEERMTWQTMMQLPDIFRVEKPQEDENEVRRSVMGVAENALNAFVSMRETEGEKMKADILNRLVLLEKCVAVVEEKAPELTGHYRERLFTKISEILKDTTIDEQRILTEAAIFSEKTAVDEETVRLHSHISQMRNMLSEDGSIGRKLDFLVQELNREVNTIGSKVQDIEITSVVVEMKSEIEKIREQIQNIE
ncbi:MAG TPA: YicC family protein [Ruminococcus sp.]|nr:YicC family protein [Ruminococcus sp.]